MIENAIILAAGLGHRMRPLTKTTPKPLISVAGKPIIEHTLSLLMKFKVRTIVVNCHYLPDQIIDWAGQHQYPPILISDEREELLDSGGGVKKALAQLAKDGPFFVANGDSFWVDGATPALSRMADLWDPETMDCLLLMAPVQQAAGYEGHGDFSMLPDGRLQRRLENQIVPFVFAGCYITTPSYFAGAPEGAFSVNRLWNRSLEEGRLFGIRHDGQWHHVGTPEAIREVEIAIREG